MRRTTQVITRYFGSWLQTKVYEIGPCLQQQQCRFNRHLLHLYTMESCRTMSRPGTDALDDDDDVRRQVVRTNPMQRDCRIVKHKVCMYHTHYGIHMDFSINTEIVL